MDIWVQIESGSSNTAWTPYSNICPITGRTGLNVYRTGKNYIANATIEQGSFNLNNGNDLASNTRIRTNGKWDVPSGSYKIGCDQGYEYVCYVYGTDGTFIDAESVKSWTNTNIPMTIVGSRKIRCGWRKPDNSAIVPSEISHPFVCVASDIATYSLDWTTPAGTVYHGTVDPVTGQLTVDWVMYTFDGSEAWTASATPHRFSTTISYYLPHPIATQPMTQGATQNVLTSIFGECVYTNADGVGYIVHNSSATLFVVNEPAATTVGDIKAIVNGMQFCYELATPLTYQLTAQEVEVLVGKNNVWTSSGPVSVTVEAPFVGTVTNPTPFEARPMLKVSGVGEITINGKTIQILESVPDFQIDCEAMEAEDNSKIYCMDFPYLEGGENEIAGDGSITALTVTPRWWTL